MVPVQTGDLEGNCHNVLNAMKLAGGKNKILGCVVLQRQPNSTHIIAGVPPVTLRTGVAQYQLLLFAQFNGGGGTANFPCYKIHTAPRGFVVEENAINGE